MQNDKTGKDTAFIKDVGTPAFVPVTMDEDVTPGLYRLTEADLIVLISELKIIVYGLKDSEEYPGIGFEACGVDSYSLSDRAKETMSISGYEESEHIGEIADVLAKDIVFVLELARWREVAITYEDVFLAVKDMHEAWCMD